MAKPPIQYMINGSSVIPVIDVGGGYVVQTSNLIRCKSVLFDDKLDALYSKLVYELSTGKSLLNYRSSKYYSYYCDRLKTENPEYII